MELDHLILARILNQKTNQEEFSDFEKENNIL